MSAHGQTSMNDQRKAIMINTEKSPVTNVMLAQGDDLFEATFDTLIDVWMKESGPSASRDPDDVHFGIPHEKSPIFAMNLQFAYLVANGDQDGWNMKPNPTASILTGVRNLCGPVLLFREQEIDADGHRKLVDLPVSNLPPAFRDLSAGAQLAKSPVISTTASTSISTSTGHHPLTMQRDLADAGASSHSSSACSPVISGAISYVN
jgi:hypothetical protein